MYIGMYLSHDNLSNDSDGIDCKCNSCIVVLFGEPRITEVKGIARNMNDETEEEIEGGKNMS